jgi:hypothetical protein
MKVELIRQIDGTSTWFIVRVNGWPIATKYDEREASDIYAKTLEQVTNGTYRHETLLKFEEV